VPEFIVIIHGPENVAGMAGLVAAGQRVLGYDAISICVPNSNFGFGADYRFGARGQPNGKGFLETLLTLLPSAEAIHIYFGRSFLGPSLLDARLLGAIGKPVFYTFLGCDARDKTVRLASDRLSLCTECTLHNCSSNRAQAVQIAQAGHQPVFVSTPDLCDELPNAHYIPLAIDLNLWQPPLDDAKTARSQATTLRVLHAPTDRLKKGTRHIIEAIDGLKREGAPIELVVAEAVVQSDLKALASTCHIAVDQLLAGVHGTFAAEMMAMSLPTIAWIDPIYRAKYPDDLPVMSANPTTIKAVLRQLCDGAYDLATLAAQSSHYTKRVHSHVEVAKQVSAYY
jgi:glycosyltransferase involved in cell wall biosynthesis